MSSVCKGCGFVLDELLNDLERYDSLCPRCKTDWWGSGMLAKIDLPLRNCNLCSRLCEGRTNVVYGEGPLDAKIIFIGEAPGYNEDKDGRPFIGRAGKMLDSIFKESGLCRSDVYITNIVKCRPVNNIGKNRKPTEEEVFSCMKYIKNEIKEISPKIICPMGGTSSMKFIPDVYISQIHGKIHRYEDEASIIPLYHPAVALYNTKMISTLIADMRVVAEEVARYGV